jgi:hypothetical protein
MTEQVNSPETIDALAAINAQREANDIASPGGFRGLQGATAAEYPPAMLAAFVDFKPSDLGVAKKMGSGGWLTRVDANEASYANAGGISFTITPSENLNQMARRDPAIAAAWLQDFGFKVVG